VQIFSLEMSKEELVDRLLSATAAVSMYTLRSGRIGQDGWWKLAEAAQQLGTAPLFIDDCASLSMSQLRARSRRRKAKDGLALIVVDYLQLLSSGHREESRQQEVSDISRALKQLAKELTVPVLVLSQLNRDLERRQDKRPILADLRESGAIEQDADVVLFIYRDEVYNEESPDRGIAEILVRKHRNGPVGDRRLFFAEHHTRFEDLAEKAR
jgi:replicative DNA helicase